MLQSGYSAKGQGATRVAHPKEGGDQVERLQKLDTVHHLYRYTIEQCSLAATWRVRVEFPHYGVPPKAMVSGHKRAWQFLISLRPALLRSRSDGALVAS
jgi:hypothetical protein